MPIITKDYIGLVVNKLNKYKIKLNKYVIEELYVGPTDIIIRKQDKYRRYVDILEEHLRFCQDEANLGKYTHAYINPNLYTLPPALYDELFH